MKYEEYKKRIIEGHQEREAKYSRSLNKEAEAQALTELNNIEASYVKSKKMAGMSEADISKIQEEARELKLIKEKEVKEKIKREVAAKLQDLQYRNASFRAKMAIKRLNGELPDSEIESEDEE